MANNSSMKYKCGGCGKSYEQKDIYIQNPDMVSFNCYDHKDKNGAWGFEYYIH